MDIDISEPNPSPNSCDCSGAAGSASASTVSQSQSSSSPSSSSSSSSDRPSDGPSVSSPRSSASSGFKRRFQSDRRPRSATLNAGCNQQYHQQTRSRNIRSIPLTARAAKSAANPDHARSSLENRRRPMLSTAGRYHSEHFQGVHRVHNDHASCEDVDDEEEDDKCTAPLEAGREAKRQKRLDGPNADNTSSSHSSNYTSSSTLHHAPSASQGEPGPLLPQRRKRAASLALEDEIQLFRKHQRNTSTSSSTSSSSSSSSRSSRVSSPVVSSRSSIRAISHRLQSRRVLHNSWNKRFRLMEKKLSSSPLASFVEQRTKRDFKHRPSFSVHAWPTEVVAASEGISLPAGPAAQPSQDNRGLKQVSKSDVQEMRAPMASTSTTGQAKPLPTLSHTQLSALHQLHLPRPTVMPAATLAVPSTVPASPSPPSSQGFHSVLVGITSRSSSHSGPGGKVPAQPTPSPSIPSLNPPITQDTLKELDLNQVLQCKQLRHDIVFDANLMFRPNFDGNRGDRKRESSHRYWLAVARELETGCRCTAFSFPPSATAVQLGKQQSIPLPCVCRSSSSSSSSLMTGQSASKQCLSERLPSRIVPLVAELRDILLALLPLSTSGTSSESSLDDSIRESHKLIMDTLDPELIAQQASHNLLNLSSLSSFFGRILKSHCAPMRDEVIECMMASIAQGGEKKDMAAVSNGLKMCFEILELMKLDITNHQLRILRPVLVEGAAEFEYKSFLEQYSGEGQGTKLDLTRKWYDEASSRLLSQEGKSARMLDVLSDGVLDILFKPENLASASISAIPPHRGASSASKGTIGRRSRYTVLPTSSFVPETLQLDLFRLQLFHGGVTDLCVVYLLLLLFRQLCSSLHKRVPSSAEVESVRKEIWTIMSEAIAARNIPSASSSGKNRNPIPTGIKKLDSIRWKDAIKDSLLQVARKAAPSTSSANADAPSQSTLDMLTAWSENNLKADGKLFMLVQTRLRSALYSLLQEELHPSPMQSTKLGDETVPSTAEAAIKNSGLIDLSNEVHLLSSRIGKVVSHHHKTYQQLYSTF